MPDGMEFTITPPSFDFKTRAGVAVFRAWMGFWGSLLVIFSFGWVIGGSGAFLFFLFFAVWIGGYWWMRKRGGEAMAEFTRTSRILVSATGIQVNGQDFSRADIHEIFVRDPRPDHTHMTYTSTAVIAQPSLSGVATGIGMAANEAASQAGADAGRAFAAHLNKRSFAVMIRYGARDVPLVEAIEQGVAELLAKRIAATFSGMASNV
ncbi:hypothetical protein CATMQ487_44610 [Sphaerotilus microaerophilus]|uniref:DUF304 domain-containing protein n=1 Tax=Sphaerotilus microaerophilus TaxID=2914710 RepID=A0ABN6PQL7_9BURK|nr:hypothetical protein CATMQ487_44610 [Sphaerotilus sp. FB-5]